MFKLRTILVLSLGIWLGMKAEGFLADGRCVHAGGAADEAGVCVGVFPE